MYNNGLGSWSPILPPGEMLIRHHKPCLNQPFNDITGCGSSPPRCLMIGHSNSRYSTARLITENVYSCSDQFIISSRVINDLRLGVIPVCPPPSVMSLHAGSGGGHGDIPSLVKPNSREHKTAENKCRNGTHTHTHRPQVCVILTCSCVPVCTWARTPRCEAFSPPPSSRVGDI